jgi:hypothetical protein
VNAPSSDAEKFNSGAQLMQIMTLCLIKKKQTRISQVRPTSSCDKKINEKLTISVLMNCNSEKAHKREKTLKVFTVQKKNCSVLINLAKRSNKV